MGDKQSKKKPDFPKESCECACGCRKLFGRLDEAGRPKSLGVRHVSDGGLEICSECYERHGGSTVN